MFTINVLSFTPRRILISTRANIREPLSKYSRDPEQIVVCISIDTWNMSILFLLTSESAGHADQLQLGLHDNTNAIWGWDEPVIFNYLLLF